MSAEHSPEINGIGKALCALQAQLTPVGKNANGHNYKYSDLPTLLDHIKPLMAACELSYTQTGEILPDGSQALVTTLYHFPSGQWVRGRFALTTEERKGINHNQAFGSSISYMRRYALAALLGVAQSDDDGAAAAPAKGADEYLEDRQQTSQLINEITRLEQPLNSKHRANGRRKYLGSFGLDRKSAADLERYRDRLLEYAAEREHTRDQDDCNNAAVGNEPPTNGTTASVEQQAKSN